MCTLIALWRAVPGYDVVVGMNRDEAAARPSEPPAVLDGSVAIVAPRDLKAGGTWIGANGHGLVVALSNRRGKASESARSRGQLVLDALQSPNVAAVELLLHREVRSYDYNHWNLLAMNRLDLRFFSFDGTISQSRGREGLNVLTNDGANLDADPKADAVRRLVTKGSMGSIHEALRTLQSTLRHHDEGESPALCVHAAGGGTVSSTILALSNADPAENVLLYADGAPCSTPYRDLRETIRRLPGPE